MKTEKGTALFIAAHSDDTEFCAGGMGNMLAQKGMKIVFLIVANKRRIYKRSTDSEMRIRVWNDKEWKKQFKIQDINAAKVLGAEKLFSGENDDSFYECNNQNIYLIKNAIEDIDPDLTFIHWPKDNHPDHAEVSKASFRALCYYTSGEAYAFEAGPSQTMGYFHPDFFIDIENHMDKIKESLMVYEQPTATGNQLWSVKEKDALYRGVMSGFKYAEAYKIIRFPSRENGAEILLPKLLKNNFKWAGTDQYPWGSEYFI